MYTVALLCDTYTQGALTTYIKDAKAALAVSSGNAYLGLGMDYFMKVLRMLTDRHGSDYVAGLFSRRVSDRA